MTEFADFLHLALTPTLAHFVYALAFGYTFVAALVLALIVTAYRRVRFLRRLESELSEVRSMIQAVQIAQTRTKAAVDSFRQASEDSGNIWHDWRESVDTHFHVLSAQIEERDRGAIGLIQNLNGEVVTLIEAKAAGAERRDSRTISVLSDIVVGLADLAKPEPALHALDPLSFCFPPTPMPAIPSLVSVAAVKARKTRVTKGRIPKTVDR